MKLIIRLLRIISLLFLITVIIFLVAGSWLVATESGLRFLVVQAQHYAPGQLHINQVKGNLIHQCELQGIDYQQENGLVFQAHTLKFRWLAAGLFDKIFYIDQLYVEGLDLTIPPAPPTPEEPTPPPQIPDIELPIKIVLADARINQAILQTGNQSPQVFHHLQLAAEVQDKLTIHYLAIDSPLFTTALTGQFTLQTPHPIDIKANWTAHLPEILPVNIAGHLDLEGDTETLTVRQNLITPVNFILQGKIADILGKLRWNADLSWDKVARWPLVGEEILVSSQFGHIKAAGDLEDYQIDANIQLSGEQVPDGRWQLQAEGNKKRVNIKKLHADILKGFLSGSAEVDWQDKLQVKTDLKARQVIATRYWQGLPADAPLDIELTGNLQDKTFLIKQLSVRLPKTGGQLALKAQGRLEEGVQIQQAELNWQKLQYPLIAEQPIVKTSKGKLIAQGHLEQYQIELDAELVGKNIPAGRWQAEGAGDLQQIDLKSVKVETLEGLLNLVGKVAWQPEVSWDAKLAGESINPAVQWQQWPGKLALDVHSQGALKKTGLMTHVKINRLQGQLRDYPLNLNSDVSIDGQHYKIKNLNLKAADASLIAQGEITDRLDLKWQINAPDLAKLLPEGKGHLRGSGQLKGTLKKPHIIGELMGKKLRFADNQVGQVTADIDVNLSGSERIQLDLMAEDIRQGAKQVLKTVYITGEGRLQAHRLTAKVKTAKEDVTLGLNGAFDPQKTDWQGQLQTFTVQTGEFGQWMLLKPADLQFSPQKARLNQSCFSQRSARLCTHVDWQADGDTRIKAEIRNIALNIAKPFFPPDFDISGELGGDLAVTLDKNGRIVTQNTLHITSGIIQTVIQDKMEKFNHQGGKIEIAINRQGLVGQLALNLLANSQIQADVRMPKFFKLPLQANQPVTGQLKAHFPDLSIIPIFVPQAERTKGEVKLSIGIGGTVQTPQFFGDLQMKNGAAELPDLGLALKDINLNLQDEGNNRLNLKAELTSGEGQLLMNGYINVNSLEDWRAELELHGNAFTVIDIPSAWALASPNIQINITPKQVDVDGEVRIPDALITPPEASGGAIHASEDVVIVNPKHPRPPAPEKPTSPMDIYSKVRVELGNNVQFQGMGFRSYLGGALTVMSRPDQVPTAQGELQIIEGTYQSYGQDLQIKKGRVIFTGGPVDNPGLDIRAFREIKKKDVIAGVYVKGRVKNPRIELYSNPTMDQSNILSYIVLGRPANQATQGEGQTLMKAAATMPLAKGGTLVKELGQEFGLDEVNLDSDSGIEGASLTLGKYLSPNLYISYGVGLFESSNIVKIHYEINNNWMLETQTGTESGIDLRYTFEH